MNESLKELAVRYFEGPIAPEEECELFGFLAASPENAALMREWEREWKQRHVPSADVLRSLARLNGKIERRENRIRARRRWLRFSAAAAVLILISAFTTRHLIHTEDPVQMFSVQAPQGTNSRISLPDGSQVWLNAGSTLNYRSDFNRSSRDIGLSGEAYFERPPPLPGAGPGLHVHRAGHPVQHLGLRRRPRRIGRADGRLAAIRIVPQHGNDGSGRPDHLRLPDDGGVAQAGRHRPVPQLDRRHHPLRRDLPPGPAPAARPRIRREDRTLHRRVRRQDLPHINHRGAGHRINHGRVVRHPADQRQARHLRLPRRQPPPKNRTLKKLLSKQT
jgi:hypothetical protein